MGMDPNKRVIEGVENLEREEIGGFQEERKMVGFFWDVRGGKQAVGVGQTGPSMPSPIPAKWLKLAPFQAHCYDSK